MGAVLLVKLNGISTPCSSTFVLSFNVFVKLTPKTLQTDEEKEILCRTLVWWLNPWGVFLVLLKKLIPNGQFHQHFKRKTYKVNLGYYELGYNKLWYHDSVLTSSIMTNSTITNSVIRNTRLITSPGDDKQIQPVPNCSL